MKKNKAKPRVLPRWAGLALGLGVVAVAALAFWALNRRPAATLPREISIAEAAAKRESGAFILDVREPDEWADYHIPGAVLIPLRFLEARAGELPRDQEIVVVCRSGNRSQAGRDVLLAAGFDQVTSMAGGLTAWRSLGYPVESGP